MANEHYEEEGHEEGEYHFSDDQVNYDMEMDAGARETAAAVTTSPKESFAKKMGQHRRVVIGLVIFIVLLGIVYKLVAPSSAPVTDFQPGAASPASVPPKVSPQKAVVPPPQPAGAPAAQTTTTTTMTQPVQPAQPEVTQPAVSTPEQPANTPPAQVSTTTTMTAPVAPPADKTVMEKIGMLEQQNSAMMNLLQTQYAQKITETEQQNAQLRTEVQELNARISNMEVAFRQLAKMLRNANPNATANASANRGMVSMPTAARAAPPRMTYVVQAIIPGRAWLKADSGDTVTVAEGDTLKGYGRVTRIDPYDGVVDIDTGNRVISLSYGMTGD
ncbi:MAG TPA: hypothetical protein VLJ15_07780 [Gammaproteobacteria bacterium]|nr:hypothetical protein [Gammaproteobacteria bacterium]